VTGVTGDPLLAGAPTTTAAVVVVLALLAGGNPRVSQADLGGGRRGGALPLLHFVALVPGLRPLGRAQRLTQHLAAFSLLRLQVPLNSKLAPLSPLPDTCPTRPSSLSRVFNIVLCFKLLFGVEQLRTLNFPSLNCADNLYRGCAVKNKLWHMQGSPKPRFLKSMQAGFEDFFRFFELNFYKLFLSMFVEHGSLKSVKNNFTNQSVSSSHKN